MPVLKLYRPGLMQLELCEREYQTAAGPQVTLQSLRISNHLRRVYSTFCPAYLNGLRKLVEILFQSPV